MKQGDHLGSQKWSAPACPPYRARMLGLRLAAVLAISALLAPCASRSQEPPQLPVFPDSWLGTWAGTVAARGPTGVRSTFEMELRIARTADPQRLTWQTTYSGDAGRQVRAYELVLRDLARGAYGLDEKNGIVLEVRRFDDTLFPWFEIRGSRLLVRHQLHAACTEDEHLSFEIVTSSDSAEIATGRGAASFPPSNMQRAKSRRLPADRAGDSKRSDSGAE